MQISNRGKVAKPDVVTMGVFGAIPPNICRIEPFLAEAGSIVAIIKNAELIDGVARSQASTCLVPFLQHKDANEA